MALSYTYGDLTAFLKEAVLFAQSKGADRDTLLDFIEQLPIIREVSIMVPKHCTDPDIIQNWPADKKAAKITEY